MKKQFIVLFEIKKCDYKIRLFQNSILIFFYLYKRFSKFFKFVKAHSVLSDLLTRQATNLNFKFCLKNLSNLDVNLS